MITSRILVYGAKKLMDIDIFSANGETMARILEKWNNFSPGISLTTQT